jgi:hypothetical protein
MATTVVMLALLACTAGSAGVAPSPRQHVRASALMARGDLQRPPRPHHSRSPALRAAVQHASDAATAAARRRPDAAARGPACPAAALREIKETGRLSVASFGPVYGNSTGWRTGAAKVRVTLSVHGSWAH